jgi:hypothetical protein
MTRQAAGVTVMDGLVFSLSDLERKTLETVCAEVLLTRELVDAVSFRADHEEFIDSIGRLCRIRYIDEDNSSQTYCPTLLTLSEVDNEQCDRVLDVGSAVLKVLYERYKNKATRKVNLPLTDLAKQLEIEREELDFTLMLLKSMLSLVLGGWTTNLRQEDAYILPAESIIKYKSMDDFVALQTIWRDQALKNSCALPELESSPPRAPQSAFFELELVEALPEGFHRILAEVEIAVPNKLTALAVMGMRAVLDTFASELVGGDNGNFTQKISLLRQKNLLSDRQIEILEAALEVGHAASHRMHVPSDEQCRQVLEIVMHLLREHYLLAPNAKKLRDTAPPRRKHT